mgnify:CR=1 FL=1
MPRAQETADSKDVQKAYWDAITKRSWIKLRPNASVPIAQETRTSQEQWFPLSTAPGYVAAPITEETTASEEITPPAGEIIHKIRAPTPMEISKPVCQPESGSSPAPRAAHCHASSLRGDPATAVQRARPASRPPKL